MAKQALLSALEDVIGEYVVNLDKENLKIQAIRGKIKMENVQLDGDLLGGLILGSMDLSGFGILSCWAKSISITVPLKNIEKEPTRIEIRGGHLLCLPLLPSTANTMFGAGNTKDPRCTLRTRVKRTKLARFEKNYISGRLDGEGPVSKRILQAAREVEREQKKRLKKKQSLFNNADTSESSEAFFDYLVSDLAGDTESDHSTATDGGGEEKSSKDPSFPSPETSSQLYELPRDWKVKLREKVMRNMEAIVMDMHLRCEVSEGGLDFGLPDNFKAFRDGQRKHENELEFDQRAFAFGGTLDKFKVRTANENWEVGSHEKTKDTNEKDHLGPNPYDARNNKVLGWENFSMYWDDDPPFLISETDFIKSPDGKLSSYHFHLKVANAMAGLYQTQEPGQKVRESLWGKTHSSNSRGKKEERPRQYLFENFGYEVRQKLSDQTQPGPISCQAEFLPFEWDWKIRPSQFVQYQKLKSAMLSQRRFDTMLRQRPSQSPLENPREWWKYAFGCITTRPNSRPWNDVLRIVRNREKYLNLVLKKLASPKTNSGYHAGLSESESSKLLALEELLPIEALMSFHLIALRLHHSSDNEYPADGKLRKEGERRGRAKVKTKLKKMFRSKSRSSIQSMNTPPPATEDERPPRKQYISPVTSLKSRNSHTILESMKIRLGRKQWLTRLKILQPRLSITLLSASNCEIVRLRTEGTGDVQLLGSGKQDVYFDISQFEVEDCQGDSGHNDKLLTVKGTADDDIQDYSCSEVSDTSEDGFFCVQSATSFMDLPPHGVVCRFAFARAKPSTKMSLSAHPATLIWTRPCFDALAEFFGAPSTKMKTELTRHLKNVSTPLARKAQLAFLSQSNFHFHINVAAPKVWVPFSSNVTDGSVLLDAGNFRMACIKPDGTPYTDWNVDARDIQVNYARLRLSEVRQRVSSALHDPTGRQIIPIIRPFQVAAASGVKDHENIDGFVEDNSKYSGPVISLDVSVSPICLNLVDVEVLAREIGKWYSQGVRAVRGRALSKRTQVRESKQGESSLVKPLKTVSNSSHVIPHYLSLRVEKIEMALEGHSKVHLSDEKSVDTHDASALCDIGLNTRTYVVELFRISARRSRHHHVTSTKLLIDDASIVQVRDSADYVPMMERHQGVEPQYCILGRRQNKTDFEKSQSKFRPLHDGIAPQAPWPGKEILKASLFQDRRIHLDEVEIDIESFIMRVTPTSLKDCVKGIRRIVELIQLLTKEMERKVHEEGRKARQQGSTVSDPDDVTSHNGRPVSPTLSIASDLTDPQKGEGELARSQSDSSLLLKVTINDGTILAGRPTTKHNSGRRIPRTFRQSYAFAVAHLMSNALVMFQSIENPTASGSKTLHISLDNLSASVNTAFDNIPESLGSPMIGPTGAEFRITNSTENQGCVVSHDISLDCEHLKSALTPNDLVVLVSIVKTMMRRLNGEQDYNESSPTGRKKEGARVSKLVRYQKSGTGIATNIRVEFQTTSFVILRAFQSKYGAPEFLALKFKEVKAKLGGCVSALSGECRAGISIDFYNSEVGTWDYAVEPFNVALSVDQMPNEVILDASLANPVQLNLTGIFLRDISEIDFQSLRGHEESKENTNALTSSALSTVGLRRATESHSVIIHNCTGLDIEINPVNYPRNSNRSDSVVRFDSVGPGLIKDSGCASIDSILDIADFQNNFDESAASVKVCLKIAASGAEIVGEREEISGLPISSPLGDSVSVHTLRPAAVRSGKLESCLVGELSNLETVYSDSESASATSYAYYHAEPVVEWCMQNQRLRSNTVDLYSLEKGRDLLSASIWSPEEDYNIDALIQLQGQDSTKTIDNYAGSPGRRGKPPVASHRSEWLRPYLKNDSPEWTDMTCILKMARERVMLPDTNWIWVNNWTVDVSGDYGESTDADGWEYQADFETFTRTRRFYERGDSCRRRRWTRTRVVKPPRLNDPWRQLKLVWETSRDEKGNFKVEVKSPVTIHNSTASRLSFFVSSPSWDEEKLVGAVEPGKKVHLPVALASALYVRLAKSLSGHSSTSITDYATSERVMIIPTSYNSNVWIRSRMRLGDVSETSFYFLLKISSTKGIVDIVVEPVLRVVNLLPCQLECQLGELLRPSESRQADSRPSLPVRKKKRIANVETITVASGKEGKCMAVNPASKPHISLRVPGHKWSCWQRIVNRKADSSTWRPDEGEEDLYLNFRKGDVDQADEFRMAVRFERLGDASRDPLVLILGVECGHSPTVRVYAQYWIVDKTGFGCHFCESFTNVMGTSPEVECSRRSHLLREDSRIPTIKRDMNIQGHQWSIGMSGMTFYFSRREKIALSVESGAGEGSYSNVGKKSKWTTPLDVSNVMPKTVLSVDERGGTRRFELAISVSVCPGRFSRTKLISVIPRYQIVNLLKREIVLAQDGCLQATTLIPSQSSVPYHWERQALPPKVRLGAPSTEEKDSGEFKDCWTNGCIQLDKIGITSMRMPTPSLTPTKPMVVQTEVRLSTKDQDSAVVIVIWSANEKSNPLYVLRNNTPHTIICRQPLQPEENVYKNGETGARATQRTGSFDCGAELSPIVRSMLGLDRLEEFVWILRSGDVTCFGFDDPEKPHLLEWALADDEHPFFDNKGNNSIVEVDAMGSTSNLSVGGGKEIRCQIGAELSTKVVQFSVEKAATPYIQSFLGSDLQKHIQDDLGLGMEEEEEEDASFSFRLNVSSLYVSFIDNVDPNRYGREILMATFEDLFISFSQSREGYHEMELRLMNLQMDNHVPSAIHPLFCPKIVEAEPFLHMSAVRRLQQQSHTYVFRYAACRMLEVNLFLDRRTAETIARYIEPVLATDESSSDETPHWVFDLTTGMSMKYSHPDRRAPREIELQTHTANSGRIYFEQLHLHPVRISLTFTQEWMELNGAESMMVFQFIRGMASIADAPLTFNSFVVAHVFESPQTLLRVISTHYSSQLTKQIFAILGSLAILGVPADFISNVGTGVRDFFYEPIQGAVHGPRQFIEGLEAGTQSLARGVFVGVVRGAANVTEVINSNLAGLTADDDFIDERKAHQRMLTDAMSRGVTSRTFYNSLFLAGASVARGVKSGAYGIVDQPTRYASKFGPVGFMKGVGKAMVGVLVKPVVGVGDAATLLMNHVSDATSKKQVFHKIPKRLRRALPSTNWQKPNSISIQPYDDRAAKAQKIVTGGESVDDVYIGHVNIPTHLIIASEQCLWAIDRGSREPWCVTWEEISHFGVTTAGLRIAVFSQTGLKTFLFQTEDEEETAELQKLLSMQLRKTGNASSNLSELRPSSGDEDLDILLTKIPGIKSRQSKHVFGSFNQTKKQLAGNVKDEIDLIEQCFGRIKKLGSGSSNFFERIDEEAWNLVSCWGQVFSGLSSRRCIAASVINGTGSDIQIKSTKLVEGGSPCYSLPTQEFDQDQGILHAGGVILFFGWGVVPSLLQPGNVFMHIETNAFIADLADQKSRDTYAEGISGFRVGFLEKSYDDAGWWAKYWLILLRDKVV